MLRRSFALSPELSHRFASQCVLAADILERYVSIGYVPDILACVAGIRRVLSLDEVLSRSDRLVDKARPIEQLIQRPKSKKLRRNLDVERPEPLGDGQGPHDEATSDTAGVAPDQDGTRPERASL